MKTTWGCAVCVVLALSLGVLGACGGSGDEGGGSGSSWSVAELIEVEDLGNAYYPQIAVDNNGNAFAVWQQNDGVRDNIWANRFDVLGGWEGAGLIENSNTSAATPQIAFDADGNAIAVWSAMYDVYANRYDAAAGWEGAVVIETTDNFASSPQIAFDSLGNALAVWTQTDGTQHNVWANRYDVVTGWGVAELIETQSGTVSEPQLVIDGSGNAFAVWKQLTAGQQRVFENRYDVVTGWGTEEIIDVWSGDASSPQVAVDDGGNALVVWIASGSVFARRYDMLTGLWGAMDSLESATGRAYNPKTIIDGTGRVLVVWSQKDDTNAFNIWAKVFDPAAGWETNQMVNAGGGDASNPRVAFDALGNAFVVWEEDAGYGTLQSIWANRYDAAAGWGAAEQIETTDAGHAGNAKVACDGSGNAIAVWAENDSTRFNIWANRYQ